MRGASIMSRGVRAEDMENLIGCGVAFLAIVTFGARPGLSILGATLGYCGRGRGFRTFLISCIAAAVISIGAAVILHQYQEPAAVAFSTSAVRL
jgi:hypothetical protein